MKPVYRNDADYREAWYRKHMILRLRSCGVNWPLPGYRTGYLQLCGLFHRMKS